MVWGTGAWGTGSPWGSPAVTGGPTTTTLFAPGLVPVSPDRILVDSATFLCSSVDSQWRPDMTDGIRPRIVPEMQKRRVTFLSADVITCRPDPTDIDPIPLTYGFKHREERMTFRCWTRVGQDHATKMMGELERCVDAVRKDSFGALGDLAGRNWLQVLDITPAERLTRKYWYREMRVQVNRRYTGIQTSVD